MTSSRPPYPSAPLDPALSDKLRFWSLMAMLLLVYVHGFNLHPRYLEPMTLVTEPASWDHVVQYLFANGLLRFRIPILFAISGYLLAYRDDGATAHGTRVWKRVRTLGIPYLAWSAIALLFIFVLEQWSPTRELVRAAELSPFGSDAPFVSGYSLEQLRIRWLIMPAAFQLWFLRTLLVLTALYPLIRTAVTRWPRTVFTLAGLLFLMLEGEGILFFTFGVWLAARRIDIQTRPTWFATLPMFGLWVLLCGIKTWMAFAFDQLNTPIAITMLLLHRAGEVVGLLAAWYGADGLVRVAMSRPWFRWVTAFSFSIYAMHVPLVNFATEWALRAGAALPKIELLTYLVVPLAVSAFAVLCGATLRRASRPLYSLLTGGRGLAWSGTEVRRPGTARAIPATGVERARTNER